MDVVKKKTEWRENNFYYSAGSKQKKDHLSLSLSPSKKKIESSMIICAVFLLITILYDNNNKMPFFFFFMMKFENYTTYVPNQNSHVTTFFLRFQKKRQFEQIIEEHTTATFKSFDTHS